MEYNFNKDEYKCVSIDAFMCKEWLINKHYAKRIPSIEYSFGLYHNNNMVGVCTLGCPPRVMNNGESVFNKYRVKTLELNRLVVNDLLPKNALSYFVSKVLKQLPKPCCVVSYADFTFGHNGYIYQATNWVYCGLNQIHERQIFYNGKEVHPRTACSKGFTNITEWAKNDKNVKLGDYTQKHRYFHFLGDRNSIKKMKSDLVYNILPYPKGDNVRYDASYQPTEQLTLL